MGKHSHMFAGSFGLLAVAFLISCSGSSSRPPISVAIVHQVVDDVKTPESQRFMCIDREMADVFQRFNGLGWAWRANSESWPRCLLARAENDGVKLTRHFRGQA
jgi:hypothetical protein